MGYYGDQGSSSNEVEEFLFDPLFAKALARTEVMPVGWATGTTGITIGNQATSTIKEVAISWTMAPAQVTGPNKNVGEVIGEGNTVMVDGNNPVEDVEVIEASSRTLGEEDSKNSPDVR